MSVYTTQVRFLCEEAAELKESAGFNDIENVLDKSWNKIFSFDFPIWDESYRETLCKKILRHYYTREIGAEVKGLWKLWLQATMQEIMPTYCSLYLSKVVNINHEYQSEYWRDVSGKTSNNTEGNSKANTSGSNTSSKNASGNSTTEAESSGTGTNDDKKRFSDTPQGGLADVDNDRYLTTYGHDNGTTSSSTESSQTVDSSNTENMTGNTSAESTEKNASSSAGTSENAEHYRYKNTREYLDAVEKIRSLVMNLDLMIINDLGGLFLNIY